VNSINELLTLIHDELGLPVTAEDADRDLREVAGWDSVQLLRLVTLLEQRTGRPVSLPAVLDAPNLAGIYAVAVRR
jgi:acyl carrier protein